MSGLSPKAKKFIMGIIRSAFASGGLIATKEDSEQVELYCERLLQKHLTENSENPLTITEEDAYALFMMGSAHGMKTSTALSSLGGKKFLPMDEAFKKALREILPVNSDSEDLGVDNLIPIEAEPTSCPSCIELQELISQLRKSMESLQCPICRKTGGSHLGGCKILDDNLSKKKDIP